MTAHQWREKESGVGPAPAGFLSPMALSLVLAAFTLLFTPITAQFINSNDNPVLYEEEPVVLSTTPSTGRTLGGNRMVIIGEAPKFLNPGQCIEGNFSGGGGSQGLTELPPRILFTYKAIDGFSFAPVTRECLPLLFHSNDTLVCQVPPGQGAPEIIVSICGQVQKHNPVWPSEFSFVTGGLGGLAADFCTKIVNPAVTNWGDNYICTDDGKDRYPFFWRYPTGPPVPNNYTCVNITGPVGQEALWIGTGWCWPTTAPYEFTWSDNNGDCILWLPDNQPAWTASGLGLCAAGNPPYGPDSNVLRYNYDPPTITSISPLTAPNTGGTILTLRGDNFGDLGVAVTIQLNPCTVVPGTYNHTFLECVVPPGEGAFNQIRLTVEGNPSSAFFSFNYDFPNITSFSPARGNTTGGDTLVLTGSNFGTSPGQVFVGTKLCTVITGPGGPLWSNNEVQCTTPAGQGTGRAITMTNGGLSNQLPKPLFSYLPPSILSVTPSTYETIAQPQVTLNIVGSNFGTSASVTVGGKPCALSGVGVTHSLIQCILPSGQNNNRDVRVTTSLQPTPANTLFSYDAPNITLSSPRGGKPNVQLTLQGFSFGTVGTVFVGNNSCPIVSHAHRQLICTVPSGSGINLPVYAQIGNQRSNEVKFTYSPVISAISKLDGQARTQGGDRIRIEGTGLADTNSVTTVKVATGDCNVLTKQENEVVCVLPSGQGVNRPVVLTAGDQQSDPFPFNYDGPRIDDVQPEPLVVPGLGGPITVLGANFGNNPRVFIDPLVNGDDECVVDASRTNDTQVVCTVPSGVGTGIRIRLEATPTLTAQADDTLSYARPQLFQLLPNGGPTTGQVPVLIKGKNFGSFGATVTISTSSQSLVVAVHNDSDITFIIPQGQGTPNIGVTIGGQSSNILKFTYNAPNITSVVPPVGPTDGQVTLLVTGTDFGQSGSVFVGGVLCPLVSASSYTNTEIRCRLPAGQGGENRDPPLFVVVRVSGRESSFPFRYLAPNISSVSPLLGPTGGGTPIQIDGVNFGSSGEVTIGDQPCSQQDDSASYSSTRIVCLLQPGQGFNLPIRLVVEDQTNDWSVRPIPTFSYRAPEVLSFSPPGGPTAPPTTTSKTILTVFGRNFGSSGTVTLVHPTEGRITPCYNTFPGTTLTHSSTSILCVVGEGQGSVEVRVNISGQVATAPTNYVFNAPRVNSIVPSGVSTTGGSVTLIGQNFGVGDLDSFSLNVLGQTLGPDNVTAFNHTHFIFSVPAGTGAGNPISLIISGQTATRQFLAPLELDFQRPAVGCVSGCSGQDTCPRTTACDTSGTSITIAGANFGTNASLISVTVGDPGGLSTACSGVTITSPHQQLECALDQRPIGGFDLDVTVTVDQQSGSLLDAVSFQGPIILAGTLRLAGKPLSAVSIPLQLTTVPTNVGSGGVNVTFSGLAFKTNETALKISYGIPGTSYLLECPLVAGSLTTDSESQLSNVTCTIGPGVGTGLQFRVQVGLVQSQFGADNISYPAPVIVDASIRGNISATKKVEHTGLFTENDPVYFDVQHVGSDPELLRVFYGQVGQPKDLECSNVVFERVDGANVTLRCSMAAGDGDGYRFQLSLLDGNTISAEGNIVYNYVRSPVVTRVQAAPGASGCVNTANGTTDCPTRGGILLNIFGSSFGQDALAITIGENDCLQPTFISQELVTCVLPEGAGQNLDVRVNRAQVFSQAVPLVSYLPAEVTKVEGCTQSGDNTVDCPRQGNVAITLTGNNFGPPTASVLVGQKPCSPVVHTPNKEHEEVVCTLASGSQPEEPVTFIQSQGQVIQEQQVSVSYAPCPVGFFSDPTDPVCQPCNPGTITSTPGQSVCVPCEGGRIASGFNNSQCADCEAGTRSNLASGATECVPCGAGTFTASPRQVSCELCPVGRAHNTTRRSECDPCPIGSHADTEGLTACTECEEGRFSDQLETINCVRCGRGTRSSQRTNSTSCTACTPGTFQDSVGATFCEACGEGTFSQREGQTDCRPCPSGRFGNTSNLPLCFRCDEGTVSGDQGPLSCEPCDEGFYMPNKGESVCLECERGNFTDQPGERECQRCPPGKDSRLGDSSSCDNCTLGRFAPEPGTPLCFRCNTGSFAPTEGLRACNECDEGQYQPLTGQALCRSCPNGTFTDVKGAATCLPCDDGNFGNASGLSSCFACPVGTFSERDALQDQNELVIGPTVCEECDLGFFAAVPSRPFCAECPQGRKGNESGLTACYECDPGFVQPNSGEKTCDSCGKGQFSGDFGLLTCTDCPAGSVCDAEVCVVCPLCPAGTFQPTRGEIQCINCPAGSFTAEEGQLSCAPCAPGRFDDNGTEPSVLCAPCPAGTQQDEPGQTRCDVCTRGRISTTDGQELCQPCGGGRFGRPPDDTSSPTAADRINCQPCEQGTASTDLGRDQPCPACGAGTRAANAGQLECEDCPAGSYRSVFDQTTCVPCTAQQVLNNDTSTCTPGCVPDQEIPPSECRLCDPGWFSSKSGSTFCTPCPVGSIGPLEGTVQCSACPPGTSQAQAGSFRCLSCSPGLFQPEGGQDVCEPCAPGTFTDQGGALVCRPCPTRQFNNVSAAKNCSLCPPGRFQDEPGSLECQECRPGFFSNLPGQFQCVPCDPGSYQPLFGQRGCLPCELGRSQQLSGQANCTSCRTGTFTDAPAQTECVQCVPGSVAPRNDTVNCTLCDFNTFQDIAGQELCNDCPPGTAGGLTAEDRSRGLTSCIDCLPGFFNNVSRASNCSQCLPGFFQATTGQRQCEGCQPGTAQQSAGQTSCQACSPGRATAANNSVTCAVCPRGRARLASGGFQCDNCTAGRFNNATEQSSCLPCAPGFYQSEEASFSCLPCPAGEVQPLSGQSGCRKCPLGSFMDLLGQQVCKVCPPGSFSNDTGLAQCIECLTGFASREENVTFCQACSPGEFAAVRGQLVCSVCLPGFASNLSNASSCAPCPEGQFQNEFGRKECKLCVPGRSQEQTGQPQCALCGFGKYSNTTGQIDCTDCLEGEFQNETGGQRCFPCDLGTFNDLTAQRNCRVCVPGRFSDQPGAQRCTQCDAGSQQPDSAQQNCTFCEPGSFSSLSGQTQCRPCPLGFNMPVANATACQACLQGTFQARVGATNCTDCPVGTFINSTGQARCSPCQPGRFGVQTAQRSCLLCPAGSSQERERQQQCNQCQPGFFSLAGQETCTLCGEGAVSPNANASQCDQCPVNSQTNNARTQCICKAGFYLPKGGVYPTNFQCTICPDGMDCGNAGVTYETAVAAEGWWRQDNETLSFFRCQVASYCVGGNGASGCKSNRVGPLCALCTNGYYAAAGGECIECPDSGSGAVVLVFLLLFVILILVVLLWVIIRSGKEDFDDLEEEKEVEVDYFADWDGNSRPEFVRQEEEAKRAEEAEAKMVGEVGGPSSVASLHAGLGQPDVREGDTTETATGEVAVYAVPQKPKQYTYGEETRPHVNTKKKKESEKVLDRYASQDVFETDAFKDPYNREIFTIYHPPRHSPNFTYPLKIFVGFLQIVASLATGLEIQWPSKFENFVLWFDITNFDWILSNATASDCIDGFGYYSKFVIVVITPPLLCLGIWLLYYLPRVLACPPFFTDLTTADVLVTRMKFWKMVLFVLFLVYPGVSSTVLGIFICKDLGTEDYLLQDLEVVCSGGRYKRYRSVAAALIPVYPVGIPAFFFFVLWSNKDRLANKLVKAQFGFLYGGYRLDVWWFEMVDLAHKLFLTSLLGFFPAEAQMPVGMGMAWVFLYLLLIVNPYHRDDDDHMHKLAQTEIILLLMAGQIFYKDPLEGFNTAEDWLFSLLLIAVVFLFFGYFLSQMLFGVYRLWHRWRYNRSHKQQQAEIELAEKQRKNRVIRDRFEVGLDRDEFGKE